MAGSSTDVRAWLREQGHDVGDRGAIRREWQDEYDAAHQSLPGPVVPGEVLDDDEPDVPLGGDVTGAAPPPAPDPERPAARGRRAPGSGERAPRRPGKASRKPKRLTERIFGSWGGGKGGARRERVPLGDFAEDTWADLAWLAAPVPPLAKILTIQSPYAGTVFDEQVKGTVVDAVLQPVARNAGMLRALNGLAGPPLYTAMICLVGGRVQARDQQGKPLVYGAGHPLAGEPVMVEDARTKMLFAGLRYSLLQMLKISDANEEELAERVETAAVRNRAVDVLVASIFALPAQPGQQLPDGAAQPGQQQPQEPPGAVPGQPGFIYPSPPVMDAAGADPGRMG